MTHEGHSIEHWLEQLDRDGYVDLLSRHTFAKALRCVRIATPMFVHGPAYAALLRYGAALVPLLSERRGSDVLASRHAALLLAAFADAHQSRLVDAALDGSWVAAAALCGVGGRRRAMRALRKVAACSRGAEAREWARIGLRVVGAEPRPGNGSTASIASRASA